MLVSLSRVVCHHSSVKYIGDTVLAKILCNSFTNVVVRSGAVAPVSTTITAAITATATTSWLTRPYHHPLLTAAPVIQFQFQWVFAAPRASYAVSCR